MSLISDIAGAIAGTTPKTSSRTPPAEISKRIGEAKSRLTKIRRQYGLACLDALDGNGSERDRLADEIEREARDLARLELALVAARQRALEETGRQASALRDSRIHSATIFLRQAEKAAKRLAASLEEATKARRDLLAASAKARASAPDPLPKGSLTEAGVLDALIAGDMHRLSYDMGTPTRKGTGALPGSKSPTLMAKDDPASIPPLVDQLRNGHDYALAWLRGGVAVPGPAVVEPPAEVSQPAQASEELIAEPADYNPDDLLPGTRTAQEVQASIPRVQLNLDDKG